MGGWRTAAGTRHGTTTDIPRGEQHLPAQPRRQGLLTGPVPSRPGHVVVVAPTGYGKTTLLSHHARALRSAGRPVAWVGLDERLVDVEQLWERVGAALVHALALDGVPAPRPGDDEPAAVAGATTGPELAEVLEVAVRATDADTGGRWEQLLAGLVGLPAPATIVLDGVDAVVSAPVLAALGELATTGTGSVQVLWAGRRGPPGASTGRWLGDVVEIGAADLALREDEVADLFAATGTALDAPGLAAVMARTEGWPAAVRLLAADGTPGGPGHRPSPRLYEYLSEHVLGELAVDVVAMLRVTSVARVLPLDLAVLLSGREDAGAVLEDVEHRLGLVRRVIGEADVHQVHPLVREVLRDGFHATDAGAYRRAHALAASWFADAGRHGAAVEHAVASDDVALLERTLLEHGLGTVLTGGAADLDRLLATRAVGRRSAVEVVHHALAALEQGDVTVADALILHARSLRRGPPWPARLEDLYRCVLLQRARSSGDPFPAEVAAVVTELRDPDTRRSLDIDVALHVMVNLVGHEAHDGDHEAAHHHLEQARALAELYGYHELAVQCMVGLAAVQLARQGLEAARAHAAPAVVRATATGRDGTAALAFAHTVVAWSAHQMLDDLTAREAAARALAALDGSTDLNTEAAVRCCEAFVGYAAGRRHQALLTLHHTVTGFRSDRTDPAVVAHSVPRTVRLCLAQGEWSWAQKGVQLTDELLPGTGESVLVHAHWAKARHRPDLARRLVQDAQRRGVRCVVTDTQLELHLLRAVLLADTGDHGGAHEALVLALATSEPDRTIRPFADAGPELLPYLVEAAGRVGSLEPWRARVTEAVRQHLLPLGASPEHLGLTPREMAVLADLPSLLPLSAIAAQHHVSPNTLKTQVKAIYRKLGVSSRHAAVTAARLSGLLPS